MRSEERRVDEEQMAWTNLLGRAREQPRRVLTCLLAGQLAGLAFLGLWVLVYLLFHHDRPFDWPIRVIATFLLGGRALEEPTALTYVLGILVNQLIPALAWSMFFAWIVMSPKFPIRLSTCVSLGLFIGLLSMGVDVFFLVPPAMGVLQDHDFWWSYTPRSWDWIAHIAYGMSLGWFYMVFEPRIERGLEPRYPAGFMAMGAHLPEP